MMKIANAPPVELIFLLLFAMLFPPSGGENQDIGQLLRHRRLEWESQTATRELQLFGLEKSESLDQQGGEFEMEASADRPGAEVDDGGPGDAFEMDAKMPKRSFEISESVSLDDGPNRGIAFTLDAPAPSAETTQPQRVSTLPPIATTNAPTTLQPTTLTPTTLKPTTIAPTKDITPEPTTLQPTQLKRVGTLPPVTGTPTTLEPTTLAPTTLKPTTPPPTKTATQEPTSEPTTLLPTSLPPSTLVPTTLAPTTLAPTTLSPTTKLPTPIPTSSKPTPGPTKQPTMPPSMPPTTETPTVQPSLLTTARPTSTIPTSLPTANPTDSPTMLPTQPSRVASLIREIVGEEPVEHDYIIPDGAHDFMIPERLVDELISTMEHGAALVEPLFGPYSSNFKMVEFLDALKISYDWDVDIAENSEMDRRNRDLVQLQGMVGNIAPTPSPNAKQLNLGGERDVADKKGRVDIALAHIGLLLGQAFEESMMTGMCDEQNSNPVDKTNPGCGQSGENYRFPNTNNELGKGDFFCFQDDKEWMSGYGRVSEEPDPQMEGQFLGCPLQPPVDIITGGKMPSRQAKDVYQEMTMKCGLEANIGSRSCCWWGRGMLQMTYQCHYGDFQKNWGSYYDVPDRDDIDICADPGQICDDSFPEMKYLVALFTWTKNVVHSLDFNFNQELEQWVDGGRDLGPGGFIDRVGGVLVHGDPDKTPPNAAERRHYTGAALDALMSIPHFGVEQYFHYGDVALCKPAVQSSIYNSTSDHAAQTALLGKRSSTKIAETDCNLDPFWQVDLGRSYQILTVSVVWYEQYHYEMIDLPEHTKTGTPEITRTNRQLVIDLLDEAGENVASLDRSQFTHSVDVNGKLQSIWTVQVENSTDLVASQVRVSAQSADNDCGFLSLAQVNVMSVCRLGDACLTRSSCDEHNVAQCKPTTQSTTVESGTANLAVDGIDGKYAETECEETPFFMVDLMGVYNISSVALINHADSNGLERLHGVVVELLDVEHNVVAEDSHEPRLMGDEMGDVYVMNFDDTTAVASKVRVSLQHSAGSCEPLKLAEVAVMATCFDHGEHCNTWENCSHQNVARCMPATQSSIFEGGSAARAVDGHTSLAHTTCEEQPWWGVHLLRAHLVTEVIIHNREDCCFERLNGIEVSLLDNSGNTVATVVHDPVTDGVIETSWTAVFAEADTDAISASKVRVVARHEPGSCESLNLAEVQVMSPCMESGNLCLTWADCIDGNIAQCKPAQQSSTIFGDVAANAVNGHESLAHTDCENAPWWEVDLLSLRPVDGVVIHNREDCCWERLNGVLVELFDINGTLTGSIRHDPATMGEIKTMWVAAFQNVVASKVRLSVQHADGSCDFLNIAEVEVRSTCQEGDACLTGYGCDRGNVAKCKPARQSSTLPAAHFMTIYQGVAGDAVDGTESLAHTGCEQKPWWEVDLIKGREVSQVVVHNREDCCFDRLNGVIVDLLDRQHNVIARVQHDPTKEGEVNSMWVAYFPPMSMAWFVRVMVEHPAGTCGFLNLAEVEVISDCEDGDACLNPEMECVQGNVAQCKPARQISTMEGAIAHNAVDSERSHSRTDCEERPWWEVDLQGLYHISEVLLFNRQDCCQEELNNVIVELLNTTGDTVKRVQHDPLSDGLINSTWAAKFDDFGDSANKVRVSLVNDVGDCSFLNLADVQVMSTCLDTDACYNDHSCSNGNVALCKVAQQSSTWNGMVASKALDGEESLSMTECEASPWWRVHLETEYSVEEVIIYNRKDCCFEQLSGVLIELLDSAGGVVTSMRHDPETMGEIRDVWVAQFDPLPFPSIESVRVSVQHNDGTCGHLQLAEVQVMSECKQTDACMTGYMCEHSALIEST